MIATVSRKSSFTDDFTKRLYYFRNYKSGPQIREEKYLDNSGIFCTIKI